VHVWDRRTRARYPALGLLLLLGGLLLPSTAHAVGTGNPTIRTPEVGAALYSGYTGPFVVGFDDAPLTTYQYSVIADPDGAATVVRGPVVYQRDADNGDHQFTVGALPADDYRFLITDNAGHETYRDFTVRSGSAPKCSLLVPPRVRVNAPRVTVIGRLSSTCAALHTATADWKVTRPGQVYDYYRFDQNTTDTWSLYDTDPLGSYSIRPLSARSSDFTEVPQNTPTVVARRDSRLVLGGSRSGSHVTLRTSLSYYSASTNAFRPWSAKYVVLAYRTCSSCSWHQLRTLTTDSTGHASYRLQTSQTREYRVRASGTSVVWAPLSAYKRL